MKIGKEINSRFQGFGDDNFLLIRHILRHNSWNDSRQITLHMLEPRFQTQVLVRCCAGSCFKMATLEIRLKRVNKIYYEGVSTLLLILILNHTHSLRVWFSTDRVL